MKPQAYLFTGLLALALVSYTSFGGHQTDHNKKRVVEAFEAVGSGDFDSLDEYIAADYVRHCQATPGIEVKSLNEFKGFLKADREVMPDQEIEVKYLVAEGDMVAFWAIYRGTQTGAFGPFPASGNRVELDFSGIHRMENGKIAETWVTWDNMSYLSQLGHLPAD